MANPTSATGGGRCGLNVCVAGLAELVVVAPQAPGGGRLGAGAQFRQRLRTWRNCWRRRRRSRVRCGRAAEKAVRAGTRPIRRMRPVPWLDWVATTDRCMPVRTLFTMRSAFFRKHYPMAATMGLSPLTSRGKTSWRRFITNSTRPARTLTSKTPSRPGRAGRNSWAGCRGRARSVAISRSLRPGRDLISSCRRCCSQTGARLFQCSSSFRTQCMGLKDQ